MKKSLFLFLLFSFGAQASLVNTGATTIKNITTFTDYGAGDIIIATANSGTTECPVYWMTKADPGFQANLSLIIAAYHAKSTIAIDGHTELRWPGTSGKSCKIYSIHSS